MNRCPKPFIIIGKWRVPLPINHPTPFQETHLCPPFCVKRGFLSFWIQKRDFLTRRYWWTQHLFPFSNLDEDFKGIWFHIWIGRKKVTKIRLIEEEREVNKEKRTTYVIKWRCLIFDLALWPLFVRCIRSAWPVHQYLATPQSKVWSTIVMLMDDIWPYRRYFYRFQWTSTGIAGMTLWIFTHYNKSNTLIVPQSNTCWCCVNKKKLDEPITISVYQIFLIPQPSLIICHILTSIIEWDNPTLAIVHLAPVMVNIGGRQFLNFIFESALISPWLSFINIQSQYRLMTRYIIPRYLFWLLPSLLCLLSGNFLEIWTKNCWCHWDWKREKSTLVVSNFELD